MVTIHCIIITLTLTNRNDLFATAGATFGLQILINLLFTSSDLVILENPSYFVATKIIGVDAGMDMVTGTVYCGGNFVGFNIHKWT